MSILEEVAKQAGVSTRTVTRACHASPPPAGEFGVLGPRESCGTHAGFFPNIRQASMI